MLLHLPLWRSHAVPVKVLSRGLCLPEVAAGDNEIEQHRNFSETHFSEVALCGSRPDGHDGDAAWDKPSQCMLPGSGRNESEFILSEET